MRDFYYPRIFTINLFTFCIGTDSKDMRIVKLHRWRCFIDKVVYINSDITC